MKGAVDLTAHEMKTVRSLLKRHLPGVAAWAYGSRVKWTSRPESDLDIVVFADAANKANVSTLREAFDESNLPFRVDLFVWDEVPERFRKTIEAEHVVIQEEDQNHRLMADEDWATATIESLIEDGTIIAHIFAYCLARNEDFRIFAIQRMTGSSGRQRVPHDCLRQYNLAVPTDEVATAFGTVVEPLYAKAKVNMDESRTLAAIRDALLPKLLSGEIRVGAAENTVGEVA